NMQNQNMNLVLSTDAKPRLKWTPELHQRFVEAVNQLGGADKATPKSLMRVMGIHGLTLYHLKSHLQAYFSLFLKYRLGKSQQSENCTDIKQEAESLQLQMEVQRKLHEQIERHLQLRIEAQGKYLQTVLKKAQETLSGYGSSSVGVELAKAELTQLVSMVNNGCPSSSFSELTETGTSSLKYVERKQMRGSMESSLTSSESSGRKEEKQPMHKHGGDPEKKRSSSPISDGICVEQPISKRTPTQRDKSGQHLRKSGLLDTIDLNRKYQNDIDSGPKAWNSYYNKLFLVMGFSFYLLLLFVDLALCSSWLQGRTLPHMTSDVNEVSGKSFDYIVVGGGTAGCPLAATLSEKFSVLLVERGSSPYGNPLVLETKNYGLSLLQTDKYTSVAQSFISNDGVPNLRGRVLGGSSAINGGFYSRASEDFVQKVGWDKEAVMGAYQWVESRIVFKPELTPWQYVAEFSFLEAGIFPYNGFSLEHIEGTKVGGSVFDEWGRRHTSADLLEAGNPNNITVLLNATVKNVIFREKGNRNETIARGIRFIKSDGNSSQTYDAYLNQAENSCSWGDVILAAGALGSPQILLLSGIGPQKHIKNRLKGVGKGMKDNPGIALLADSKPKNFPPEPPKVVGIADHFKIIIEAGILPISLNATVMPIAAKLASPESEGKLELNSTDPRENPSVTFNYLAKEKDWARCVKLGQLLERVVRSESIAFFLGLERKNELMSTEDELRKLCKKNVRTFYHYHGGCSVGSVVDKDYRVYGVKGLRVVDGSTFLESPGTNPMATLLMLGRYQGIKILEDRN
ncbi:Glucose-methanol-choline oxidoreductase family protein, partial [Prunus dulcis]